MATFHSSTYLDGATLELFRDPESDNWVIRIFGEDHHDELYSARIFGGLTLATDPGSAPDVKLT
jgi:hypothetical protein